MEPDILVSTLDNIPNYIITETKGMIYSSHNFYIESTIENL